MGNDQAGHLLAIVNIRSVTSPGRYMVRHWLKAWADTQRTGYDIGNVANIQPDIYRSFGHIDILPWVALSFATANLACIPLARRLTGIFDLRIIMGGSTVVFFVGAALCATSQNIHTLIAGRVVNGIGSCGVYQWYVMSSMCVFVPG